MRLNHEGMWVLWRADFGSRCTNMHCHKSRSRRYQHRLQPQKHYRESFYKSHGPQPQNDGSYLIPTNIHLEMEDSLPKYFGYKTDKKSTEEGRRATLRLLYDARLEIQPGARNRRAIAEFGPPSSNQRKRKLLSWMDGRIAKSKRPNLKASLEKLQGDRNFVVDEFQ